MESTSDYKHVDKHKLSNRASGLMTSGFTSQFVTQISFTIQITIRYQMFAISISMISGLNLRTNPMLIVQYKQQ